MPDNDASLFAEHLNRFGYPFHYRTLKEGEEVCVDGKSKWVFEASEFPVAVNGHSTRIDYILKWQDGHVHLIVECKRANPDFCKWFFVKTPYVRRGKSAYSELLVETIFYGFSRRVVIGGLASSGEERFSGSFVERKELSSDSAFPMYDLGFELKTSEAKGKDERKGAKGNGDIEGSATQVSIGVNGLAEYYRANLPSKAPKTSVSFIPVIVTTAELFGVQTDLSEADVSTGNISSDQLKIEPKEWVYLQYPVSPVFKHGFMCYNAGKMDEPTVWPLNLGERLESEFRRSIVIVQGKHFGRFLNSFGKVLFGLDAPDW